MVILYVEIRWKKKNAPKLQNINNGGLVRKFHLEYLHKESSVDRRFERRFVSQIVDPYCRYHFYVGTLASSKISFHDFGCVYHYFFVQN